MSSTARSGATHHCKKLFLMGLSFFRRGFNPSKCKTMAKMTVARVKLLRNKRDVVIKQMRRDIAMLLQSGQDSTARIRVEHVIREQNIMAANELIELFCELIVSRLSIIAKQRECPADLKEGISSLIFAAPRCSDIPELLSIRDVFQKKYGKDFVSTATELRPNAGVNRMLIEKLSVKTPPGEIKLKVLKEIAKEYQVQWDTAESEEELLKLPEERIEGPEKFISATSLPLKPVQKQYHEPLNPTSERGQIDMTTFQSLASAAGVAAENAVAAAEAAAALAAYGSKQMCAPSNQGVNDANVVQANPISRNGKFLPNGRLPTSQADDQRMMRTNSSEYSHRGQRIVDDEGQKMYRRQSYNCHRAQTDISFDESDCDEEIEMEEPPRDARKIARRHSYNVPPPQQSSGISYDESDGEEDREEVNDANVVQANPISRNGKFLPNGRLPTSQADDQRMMRTNSSEYSHRGQRIVDDEGQKMYRRQSYNCHRAQTDISFDESDCDEEIEMEEPPRDARKIARRHSYNVPPPQQSSGISYDESDGEEDREEEELDHQPTRGTHPPPNRQAPQVPPRRVHPKLPDYDAFAARFEALKHHNTQSK